MTISTINMAIASILILSGASSRSIVSSSGWSEAKKRKKSAETRTFLLERERFAPILFEEIK
jgi:hypothetical protein